MKTMLARLQRALDPLRARLRRDELKLLARRLARKLPGDPAPLPLIIALLEEADAAVAERRDRRAALDRLGDALATHGPAATRVLMDDAGGLDLDAVVEREARAVGRLDGRREVCLVAAGSLAANMMVAGPSSPPPPSRLAPEATLPARILAHAADRAAPWTVRVAALDAVRALLAAWPWPMPAPLVELLDRMADDGADSRWVQVAALRALGVADLGRGRIRARARVLSPRATTDDGIVRARAARLLLHELRDPASGAALGVAARDPSEHVRQSVARACAESGDPACRQLLAILSDEQSEPSPRVRAVAALVHAERAGGSAGPLEQVPAARALARVLVWDRDPLALGVAADAAADRCRHPGADADVRDILATALGQARARADLPPPVTNAVARAAERAGAGASGELRARLVAALASGEARVALPAGTSDDDIGRALAELAQGDLGLYAHRDGDTLVVKRGERLARRAWRVLHELRRPQPSKRQGFLHTVGRVYDGQLRAHPSGMAEIAPTRVPGERVFVRSEGGWGSYLPLVDDLLSLGDAPARLYSEHGCTVVRPPEGVAARLSARARLTGGYAELAALRLRSLEARDPAGRGAYLGALRDLGFGIRFEPYDGGVVPAHIAALFARRRRAATAAGDSLQPAQATMALVPLGGLVEGLGRMFGDPGRGGVGELALFTAAAAALLAGRSLATRADIAACRRAIPLVVGGWGTRGKSGVERLKAALFHALGYEVVAKTTGCEATLLLGVPGQALTEVPLYRPYEKATIWEQRDVLRFAGTRRPHVLLWECMALNPGYVDLLQRGWMRDDVSTLTNAYPDHEDIQGPSGADVAEVIAGFTPSRATLVTAEDQMLPVIRERARVEKTRLVSVGPHAHDLLPADLLARFPYQEHPRNVALVMALAEDLGIDPEVALVEMADHVLPDVGGLRSFGPLVHAGRGLRFHNGMSANERASAAGNWQRLGLGDHRVDEEPGRWIVAFVNNRADRAARTAVFADALVEDFAAHRVVLAGSNTSGMRQAIERALSQRLEQLTQPEVPDLLAHMKVGAATVTAALAELEAWLGPADAPAVLGDEELAAMLEAALESPGGVETLAVATRQVETSGAPARLRALLAASGVDDGRGAATVSFAQKAWARRRAGARVAAAPLSPASLATLRELFLERLVEPHVAPERIADSDALVAALAAACPPGVTADVMGLANIKGPGLALVHLFDGADRALARVAEVEAAPPEARDAALARLQSLQGLTPLVLRAVADRLEAVAPAATPVIDELRARAAVAGRGGEARAPRPGARLMQGIRRSLDHLSSSTRRRRADRLFADLARGRVAVTRAARELGDVNLEQKL